MSEPTPSFGNPNWIECIIGWVVTAAAFWLIAFLLHGITTNAIGIVRLFK